MFETWLSVWLKGCRSSSEGLWRYVVVFLSGQRKNCGNQSQSERETDRQAGRQTGRLIQNTDRFNPNPNTSTPFNVQTGQLVSLCSLHPPVIPQTSRPPLRPPASLSTRPVNTASVLNRYRICTLFWPTILIPARLGQFPGGTLQMGKHF